MQRQNLLMAGCIAIMVSGCCSLHHRPEIFKPPGLRQDAYLNACGPIYQPTPLYPADPMHRLKSLRRKKHGNKDAVYAPLAYPGVAYPVDPCAPVAGFSGAYPVSMNLQLYSPASNGVVYGIQAGLLSDDCGCDVMSGALPGMNPYGAVPVAPTMLSEDCCGCQQSVVPACDSCVDSTRSHVMPAVSHVMPVVPARTMPVQSASMLMPMQSVVSQPVYQQPIYQQPMPRPAVSQQMQVFSPVTSAPIADASCMAPSGVLIDDPGCQIPQQSSDPSCSIPDVMWMPQGTADSVLNMPVPPEQSTVEAVDFLPSGGSTDTGSKPADLTPFDNSAEQSNSDPVDESPSQEFTPLPMDVDQTSWQQPIEIAPQVQFFPEQAETRANSQPSLRRVALPGHRIVTREVRPIPVDQ